MTDADGFPTMTECRCGQGEPEGPQPNCREHGCPACLGRRSKGHAYGCLYTGPDVDDVPLSWIFR